MKKCGTLLILFILCCAITSAQQRNSGDSNKNTSTPVDDYFKNQPPVEPEKYAPPPAVPFPTTQSAETVAADEAYENWRKASYEHRTKTFQWQLFSGQIIFWMVIALVCTGIYFSWVQFKQSVTVREKSIQPADMDPAVGEPPATVHELKLSLQGVEIRSSVIGLIILTISFGFFYLYLDRIYPIREVGNAAILPNVSPIDSEK